MNSNQNLPKPSKLSIYKPITTNKRAKFDYHVLETFGAGMALSTFEVKGIRNRTLTPEGAFVIYQNNRLEIITKSKNPIPLLLKPLEIKKIKKAILDKGISCIVLSFNKTNRFLKAQIALVKGKKDYDKKETIKQRDLIRERERSQD
jgi:SsrA-binding protein